MAKVASIKSSDQFLDSLKKEVEADGHVMTTTMLSLRNGFGYGRLGPHVAQFISGRLASAGLGHAPSPLPLDQFQTVLIYTLGSPVANLVDAALRPSEAGAKALRNAGGGQAADLLAQIKALVCE